MIENDYDKLTKELIELNKEINFVDTYITIQEAKPSDLINLLKAINQTRDNLRALKAVIE